MSGLDVLGAAASISQLCFYITQTVAWVRTTLKNIEQLPQQLRERSQYLDSLDLIIQSIAQRPSLQTFDIEPHLQTIKDDIVSLRYHLSKCLDLLKGRLLKRFWKVCWVLCGTEKEIFEKLTILERNKSNLQLYLVSSFVDAIAPYPRMNSPSRTSDKVSATTVTRQRRPSELLVGRRANLDNKDKNGKAQDLTSKTPEAINKGAGGKEAASFPKEGKRKWGNVKANGDLSEAMFGDDGRTKEHGPAGEREWNEIEANGYASKAFFGDRFADSEDKCQIS